MKCIMYHYVRPGSEGLDFFRYLHIDHFRRQLDWFEATSRFVSRGEFFEAASKGREIDGVVLTFDDGFEDHYRWVLPELKARGLWGLFFVSTAPYHTGKLLDVHRIHLLLGREGGVAMMEALHPYARDDMFSREHLDEFRRTYSRQNDDAATLAFKRAMNYYISYQWRGQILDALMAEVFGDEHPSAGNFYMQPEQLRALDHAGMVIGSHSATHPVFSRLGLVEQEAEIRDSFSFLRNLLARPVNTFAYPHGLLTPAAERLLDRHGCILSFNVEPRDLAAADFSQRPQALPRYDCNQFPFGRASMGPHLAPPPWPHGGEYYG